MMSLRRGTGSFPRSTKLPGAPVLEAAKEMKGLVGIRTDPPGASRPSSRAPGEVLPKKSRATSSRARLGFRNWIRPGLWAFNSGGSGNRVIKYISLVDRTGARMTEA